MKFFNLLKTNKHTDLVLCIAICLFMIITLTLAVHPWGKNVDATITNATPTTCVETTTSKTLDDTTTNNETTNENLTTTTTAKAPHSSNTYSSGGSYYTESTPSSSNSSSYYTLNVKLTAYCGCRSCSGGYGNMTSTGVRAVAGRTIAVDPRVIPYGSRVEIYGHIYVAEDCGGAIKGNKIDIYFDSHSATNNFGVQYATVKVYK